MKVLKPQKLGILSRCFEHGRRFYMGVSALAMYPLGRTDTLIHEVAMWKLAAERLGAEGQGGRAQGAAAAESSGGEDWSSATGVRTCPAGGQETPGAGG